MLVEYHRNLLADRPRNDAFYRALQKVIKPGETTVADIGSGTGLLAFLASKLGAKDVYLYEYGDVLELSQRIAKDNKIKNLHFHHGHSTEAKKTVPVDVIVSETLGNFGLEEHIIATLEDAKRFLKPGGVIIPQTVDHYVAPVATDRFFRELTLWDGVGYDLDYSAARTMSLNNLYVRSFDTTDLLDGGKTAQRWDAVDFRQKNSTSRRGKAAWTLDQATVVYGFAVWWQCELVPGVDLSTSPLAPRTHWEQLYFPVLEPLNAAKGDVLEVEISSKSSYQNGTTIQWEIDFKPVNGKRQRQSLDLGKGFLA